MCPGELKWEGAPCQLARGLEVGVALPLGLALQWLSHSPLAGYSLENGGNVGRLPWRAVRRVEAVAEGMLGESIVHVQEEKGFELVHPARGGSAGFRQCGSAQLCLLAFTKKDLMLSFQTGSSLSSSPWTCLLPSRHAAFGSSGIGSSRIQGGWYCWLDQTSWPVSDPNEES